MSPRLSILLRLISSASILLLGSLAPPVVKSEGPVVPLADSVATPPQQSPTTAKGRCTVRHNETGWWLVAPTGEPFFSLGICMFNQGSHRDDYDSSKPSYAALRHYEAPDAWADSSLKRIKSWGFTTIGGWSDYPTVLRQTAHQDLWLTPVLHLGSTSGAPWFDMWDEKVLRRIEEVAVQNMGPLRGNPRVLGYYSDNEIGWWNAILWKMTLEQPASSGQRQRLVQLLRDVYANDWSRLTKDFDPENTASWQELEQGGKLWLRPSSDGIRTMRRFLALVADRYYQVMRDTIRKHDAEAMYLGDRYQSFYYPEVVAASRPYVDIASTNLNASWNDGTFIHAYLDTLHELTGKPVLVSEFYMAAEQNHSGNRNAVGGFPIVVTQAERARALSNTVQSLARLPYVVGADWFQYYDEPPHGRKLDGEDYNFGLVDINDRPYDEVTAAFSKLNFSKLKVTAPTGRAGDITNVPRAPKDPYANYDTMGALRDWDRVQGFVHPSSQHAAGDLYVCWSPEALFLGTYVLDIVEPDYYRDSQIRDVDRATWSVNVDGRELVTARIGAGKPPTVSDAKVRIKSISGTYHYVRCITVIELPAELLGRKQLKPGDHFKLDTRFTTHGRAQHIDWKDSLTLAD